MLDSTFIKKIALILINKVDLSMHKQFIDELDKSKITQPYNGVSIFQFDIPGLYRDQFMGQHVISEGEFKNTKGENILVLLFVDGNNHLYELEIINWENDEVGDIVLE